LQLRHQRNPDVVYDFVRSDKGLTEDKPDFIYHTIETLLPTARHAETTISDEDRQKGEKSKPKVGNPFGFLELWAKPNTARNGWISVAQKLNEKDIQIRNDTSKTATTTTTTGVGANTKSVSNNNKDDDMRD
jgi:hypothetical protein